MSEPKEYDAVNPIWQRGRDWGINEERERILNLVEENIHHFAWVESDLLREIVAGQK